MLVLGGLGLQPAQARDRDDDRRERREQRAERRQQDAPQRDERRGQWQQQDEGRGQWQEPRVERRDFRMEPGEAARRAQQRNGGGRVLGVNPANEGYEVRLLKQGEVRTLMVPEE